MLQAIISNQALIREDIKNVHDEVKENREAINKNGQRITKVGIQIAELEDDTPTIREFDKLKQRVRKLEKRIATN